MAADCAARMALEFALRPRINLERPPPRRRLAGLRLPPLALPIAAYWLAIVGVTHALLRVESEAQPASAAELASPALRDEVPEEPERVTAPAATPLASVTAAPEAAPLQDTPPPASDATEPAMLAAQELARHEPSRQVSASWADAPAPAPRAPPAVARRSSAPRPEPPTSSVAQAEPRAPAPEPFLSFDDAPLRLRDVPSARLSQAPLRDEAPAREETPRDETPVRDEAPSVALPSCESAAASNNESMDLRAARGAPDLTRGAFAAVLENGAYLSRCAIPERTALEICAAVRDGKVVGVSATSSPRSPAINACVRRAVAGLRFPRSSRLDVTRTRFEPAR